jgi:molecular chaperone IbpA
MISLTRPAFENKKLFLPCLNRISDVAIYFLRDAETGLRHKSLGEDSGDLAMTTTFSLAPLFRQSVGFDRFNDLFESALRSEAASTTYPPHNVEKHGDDHYRIVIAAAGLTEEDLDIQVEKEVLTIAGGKRESDKEAIYLHQGIAQRAFRLSFRLADHIEVQNASLANGLLSIDLLRVVPEEAKPKRINIDGSGKSDMKQLN